VNAAALEFEFSFFGMAVQRERGFLRVGELVEREEADVVAG
jgi:hypothetical protein